MMWRLLCRIGLHAMLRDDLFLLFALDLYALCRCGRERLPLEVVNRESWVKIL